MKHILIILLAFAGAIAALHAADPEVKIESATRVLVDGQDYGKPLDAIVNNPQLAPAIQRALEKWMGEVEADKAKQQNKATEKEARVAEVIRKIDKRLEKELATGDGPKAQLLRQVKADASASETDAKLEALEAELEAKKQEIKNLKASKP